MKLLLLLELFLVIIGGIGLIGLFSYGFLKLLILYTEI